jgi:hypothetical protein
LAARSRKRGQRAPKPRRPLPVVPAPDMSRGQRRDAEARSQLAPLAPGERPWPIVAGAALTALAGLVNLALFVAGVKIAGKHPAFTGILIFSVAMIVCAIGMWRLWYQAVLAFMVLLAVVIVLFSLFLIEASNLLGLLVPPVFIIGGGYLFWKLVRVLGRLQMPAPPRRT